MLFCVQFVKHWCNQSIYCQIKFKWCTTNINNTEFVDNFMFYLLIFCISFPGCSQVLAPSIQDFAPSFQKCCSFSHIGMDLVCETGQNFWKWGCKILKSKSHSGNESPRTRDRRVHSGNEFAKIEQRKKNLLEN